MVKIISIPSQRIIEKIYVIRNEKVMLDSDLAAPYGVETKVLNQAVKRNIDRFPEDFMFQLSSAEWQFLRSQIVTSNERGGKRKLPYVFTEQEGAMLSGVLNSSIAVHVNIQIIRVFTEMRRIFLTHKDIIGRIEQLERKVLKQEKAGKRGGQDIHTIFEVLKKLLTSTPPERKKIGYKVRE